MFETILLAVDGSKHSMKAAELAADLAQTYRATLLILGVYRRMRLSESSHSLVRANWTSGPLHTDFRQWAEEAVKAAKSICDKHDIPAVKAVIRQGPPARTIIKTAKERQADAIVMGSRGLGDVGGLLLGSVSHKVSNLAECTTITVK